MRYLVDNEVIPRLKERYDGDDKTRSLTILTAVRAKAPSPNASPPSKIAYRLTCH